MILRDLAIDIAKPLGISGAGLALMSLSATEVALRITIALLTIVVLTLQIFGAYTKYKK